MTQPGSTSVNNSTLIAAVVLMLALIGAGVFLAVAPGWGTAEIIGLLTAIAGLGATVVAMIDKLTRVERVNVAQSRDLTEIRRSVNGELDAKIEAAAIRASEAVLDRFLNGPIDVIPVSSTPPARHPMS